MPKIDIAQIAIDTSTNYSPPHNRAVEGRSRKRLTRAAGLTQFGVNVCTLKPGAASSQRHWHENEDEFVYVLEGEVVLCEDDGETVLKAGDSAAWRAGVANGHCLVNRSDRDAAFIEVGTRAAVERAHYSDIDMKVVRDDKGFRYTKKNGESYPIGA
ncbi:MAG TPA: cupin domain-containing protein [Pseudolabrys sp.]|nr:cupin domain-containing protein [Pseudolabrys sp.]